MSVWGYVLAGGAAVILLIVLALWLNLLSEEKRHR
jgi:hypothetical protein